jgi:hypothetical protein
MEKYGPSIHISWVREFIKSVSGNWVTCNLKDSFPTYKNTASRLNFLTMSLTHSSTSVSMQHARRTQHCTMYDVYVITSNAQHSKTNSLYVTTKYVYDKVQTTIWEER